MRTNLSFEGGREGVCFERGGKGGEGREGGANLDEGEVAHYCQGGSVDASSAVDVHLLAGRHKQVEHTHCLWQHQRLHAQNLMLKKWSATHYDRICQQDVACVAPLAAPGIHSNAQQTLSKQSWQPDTA